MSLFCGIDWSERHHDVAVIDETGKLIVKRRILEDPDGLRQLLDLLAEAGDTVEEPIPVAIETSRGLLVNCLRASGRPVYSVNPLAVAAYRGRHSVSGAKSDHADAMILAHILRTDADVHRPLPHDSALVQAIGVLARAQQDAVWSRTQLSNQLRPTLREYFPAGIEAFDRKNVGLTSPEARAILTVAPTPTAAAALTESEMAGLLRAAGRQRNITVWTRRLAEVFARPQLHQLPQVEQAFGHHAANLMRQLDAACRAADDLAAQVAAALAEHPDAPVILSFPGLGTLTGSRVLAEIGGDHHSAALRNLFNRLLGQLHYCLQAGQPYQEATAFPPAT